MKKKLFTKFCALFICIAILSQSFCAFGASKTSAEDKLLKIGVTDDLDTLNPFTSNANASYEIFFLVYDPLVQFDKNLATTKSLAEKWEVSNDHLTWTFHLRKDAKWQDGVPFTSADVKFSYETYMKHQKGMYSGALSGITTITTPDDYTVVIKTEKPKANMLLITAPIVPEHIWKNVNDIDNYSNTQCIGTGPFKMVEWKKGDHCIIKANSDFYGGKVKIDGVLYKLYANVDTMAQSLKQGEIDVAEGLKTADTKSLSGDKSISLYKSEENGFDELAFNCSTSSNSKGNPALRDVKVRQAIETAIDKKKIVSIAYTGDGIVGSTIIPHVSEWFYNAPESELNSYNADEANKILDEAGYSKIDGNGYRVDPDGKELSLSLISLSDSTTGIKAAQMIKNDLKAVKINVNLGTLDDGALNDRITKLNYDMFIWDWVGDVDPSTLLNVLTTSNIGILNDANYSNKQFDELVDEQQTKVSDSERKTVIDEAQKVILNTVPYCVLVYKTSYEAVRTDRIHGLTQTQKLKNGPIFYANTRDNYMNVTIGNESGSNPAAVIAGCGAAAVLVVAIVLIVVYRLKKRNQDDEE